MANQRSPILDILVREWLLVGSLAGVAITSLYLHRLPAVTTADMGIIFLLTALFVTVKGLENSGLLSGLAYRLEGDSHVVLKLTAATFFASMFFTNDAALVVIVPITMSMRFRDLETLVIMESLAANAGSALTPFGNPQNLYIYWHYGLRPLEFLLAIAPFSAVFLAILAGIGLYMAGREKKTRPGTPAVSMDRRSVFFVAANVVVILTILKLLPIMAAAAVLVFILSYDPRCFRIDYGLILTMLCFLAVSENLKGMFQTAIEHADHIFILSSMTSQIISNVPAALLFAKFTTNWKALLWGTNVGGFGGLIGSLANLIAYKIYLSGKSGVDVTAFTRRFVTANYVFFAAGIALFYLVRPFLF